MQFNSGKVDSGAAVVTAAGNCLNPIFRRSPLTAQRQVELRHKAEADLLWQTDSDVLSHVTNSAGTVRSPRHRAAPSLQIIHVNKAPHARVDWRQILPNIWPGTDAADSHLLTRKLVEMDDLSLKKREKPLTACLKSQGWR